MTREELKNATMALVLAKLQAIGKTIDETTKDELDQIIWEAAQDMKLAVYITRTEITP